MKSKNLVSLLGLAILSTLNPRLHAVPLGTAFTYQGRLTVGTNATTSLVDFEFRVFDDPTAGGQFGPAVTRMGTPVTNGLFTVQLDFSSGVFLGDARWLQIGVRTNRSDAFTILSPRQQLTPSPYALWAAASGSANGVAATNLTGTLLPAQLPANVALLDASQTFSGVNVFNGQVGIGMIPAYTLDAQGGQAVGRFISTNTSNGSVLELRNTYASATTLGAINFNDSGSGYPGQIACYRTNALAFRVAGVNAKMLLNSGGLNVQGALTSSNLFLPATGAGSGIIYFGGTPCILASGLENFFAGQNAGNQTMPGSGITAVGCMALAANTEGDDNTASGVGALSSNTTGSYNTANGFEALSSNTTGSYNTANGFEALSSNATGSYNTANGYQALLSNTSGGGNTANGEGALYHNTSGHVNTASGNQALYSNTNGNNNTASGNAALYNNTSGHDNIALGYNAGQYLVTGNNNIYIGNNGGTIDESGAIRMGTSGTHTSTFIAGISGVTSSGGAAVYVNSDGQLGTLTSSRRFKTDVQDMNDGSDALLALRPVTFKYRPEIDPKGLPQFGLIAEEVGTINPDLVIYDDTGKPYTVRYEAVNAMLLNEFLKEHKKVEAQSTEIQDLKQSVAKLEALVEKLAGK